MNRKIFEWVEFICKSDPKYPYKNMLVYYKSYQPHPLNPKNLTFINSSTYYSHFRSHFRHSKDHPHYTHPAESLFFYDHLLLFANLLAFATSPHHHNQKYYFYAMITVHFYIFIKIEQAYGRDVVCNHKKSGPYRVLFFERAIQCAHFIL